MVPRTIRRRKRLIVGAVFPDHRHLYLEERDTRGGPEGISVPDGLIEPPWNGCRQKCVVRFKSCLLT